MGDEIERLRDENLERTLRDGPRLRCDTNTWVEARAEGMVLVGGLGGMGLGSMWMSEQEWHKDKPGYDEAPFDATIKDGFGCAAGQSFADALREMRG